MLGSFTPDGKQVVFHSRKGGSSDVYSFSLDENIGPRRLIQTDFDESHATVSPDGRWLAHQSNESGQDEFYVRPFPGVELGKWQGSINGGREPRWGPRGFELFYRTMGAIAAVPVDLSDSFTAGNPEILFRGDYVEDGLHTYDVSPDGQRFLMLKEASGAR